MVNRIDAVVGQSSVPIGEFTQTGLPEFVRFTRAARNLTADLERLIARIERDPARFFLGGQAPEFRR
jgi:phospholipid/cholesterol/gamma-HCH transport system substrate-binding protein